LFLTYQQNRGRLCRNYPDDRFTQILPQLQYLKGRLRQHSFIGGNKHNVLVHPLPNRAQASPELALTQLNPGTLPRGGPQGINHQCPSAKRRTGRSARRDPQPAEECQHLSSSCVDRESLRTQRLNPYVRIMPIPRRPACLEEGFPNQRVTKGLIKK